MFIFCFQSMWFNDNSTGFIQTKPNGMRLKLDESQKSRHRAVSSDSSAKPATLSSGSTAVRSTPPKQKWAVRPSQSAASAGMSCPDTPESIKEKVSKNHLIVSFHHYYSV